jgi:hypothetical protein
MRQSWSGLLQPVAAYPLCPGYGRSAAVRVPDQRPARYFALCITGYFARIPTGWYAVASCGMNDRFSQMEVGAVSRPLGRSLFVAAAGAVTGWLISVDLDWATSAGHRECAQSTGICFGIAVPAGLALGPSLTITASWVTMAVAGARPMGFTVPAAIICMYIATQLFLRVQAGGGLHPAWAYSLTTAVALKLPGAVVWWPRRRRAL